MTSASERAQFLDISKGLGMMMIVWMHIWGNCPDEFPPPDLLNGVISSIYVPLFFVLSGYLIKIETLDVKREIRKKTRSLVRPFILMYIFSFAVSFILSLIGFGVKHEFAWSNILNVVYSQTFFNGPLWFLLSLYWAFLIFYAIVALSKKKRLVIVLLSFIIGYIGFRLHDWNIILPFFIGPGLVACPLLVAGGLVERYLVPFVKNNKRIKTFALLLGLILFAVFRIGVSMQNNVYGGSYLFLLMSVLGGSVMVLCFSMFMERWLKPVAYWGKFSLVILCFHNFILIPTAKIIGKFIHSPLIWALTTLVIVYLGFLVIIPVISKVCPALFNIKRR